MATLKDIITLAKNDASKFFVIDDQGEVKLVIMHVDDYEKLMLGKIKRGMDEVEKINKEIIQAQLTESLPQVKPGAAAPAIVPPVLSSSVSEPSGKHSFVDLREEVIDPSFDFEGPKINIDDI